MAIAYFRPRSAPKRPPAPSLTEQISLRQTYKLTPEETDRFHAMARSMWKREGFMLKFWQDVATTRGLDPATVIGNTDNPITFSALPWNHGKHWCWPEPLVIMKKPPAKYLEERPHA